MESAFQPWHIGFVDDDRFVEQIALVTEAEPDRARAVVELEQLDRRLVERCLDRGFGGDASFSPWEFEGTRDAGCWLFVLFHFAKPVKWLHRSNRKPIQRCPRKY